MTIQERIDYINTMSASIAAQHRELIALQDRIQELRRLHAGQESARKARRAVRRHSPNEKVSQLFSGSNLIP